MWNYNFITSNFVVLVIFLFIFFIQPRISIKMNKVFFRLLILEIVILVVDVIASYTAEHFEEMPLIVPRIFNTVYFTLFLLRAVCFLIFTFVVLGMNIQSFVTHVIETVAVAGFTVLFFIWTFYSKSIFFIDSDGYTRGPAYNLIYVFAFACLLLSFIYIFVRRKYLSKRRCASVALYNGVLVVGYAVRILFQNVLIMDTFCMISIILIYLAFENPEFYLDRKSGLFNSNALKAVLSEHKKRKPFSLCGFSIYNYLEMREVYTAAQIDKVIVSIANYLTKTFSDFNLFYIHNGRFILFSEDKKNIQEVIGQIKERCKKPWSVLGYADEGIFLEVGFVSFAEDLVFKNANKLMNGILTAFKNLEEVKENSILVTNDTLNTLDNFTEIKRSLERALENNEVEMFLQPVADSKTDKIIGAEALARIRNSKGEIIPPVEFITYAEHSGKINLLGEQMFEKACKFIKNHDITNAGLKWINVNLSPVQFMRPDLNDRFSRILQKYDIDANLIHLEITEESLIDYTLLQKQISTMKLTGFQFVLDDYGKGYSNVTRLKHCPFINVKLDMEVVWDYYKDKDKILPTLVQTFKQMEFTVTAEGIETKEMARELSSIGCDYLQGYYLSKPIPAEDFAKEYL